MGVTLALESSAWCHHIDRWRNWTSHKRSYSSDRSRRGLYARRRYCRPWYTNTQVLPPRPRTRENHPQKLRFSWFHHFHFSRGRHHLIYILRILDPTYHLIMPDLASRSIIHQVRGGLGISIFRHSRQNGVGTDPV